MKKLLTSASIILIAGLSYFASKNTTFDLSISKKAQEKTYIVEVSGDLKKDSKEKLRANREEAIAQLKFVLPEDSFEITNVYDTITNGFSVKINSDYKDVLKTITNVKGVSLSHTYARPMVDKTPMAATSDAGLATKSQRLENYSAETMSATDSDLTLALTDVGATTDVQTQAQKGKKVAIGIIDTGMYINQIAGTDARTTAEANAVKSKVSLNAPAFKDIDPSYARYQDNDILPLLNADKKAGESKATASYYTRFNNKIFFARDYAGKDNNVDPTKSGSEHGTHVASIAAANGDEMKGIAPNAQIAVLKVFGDEGGGAGTDAIIKALEDSAKLGLDVVNLSLGSDLTTDDDNKDDSTYKAIEKCREAGVIVNYSAGNAGKLSYSSSKTYSDWSTDMVETGILGSSAHFDESANIIASSNNNRAFYSSIMTVTRAKTEEEGGTGYVENPVPVAFSDQAKPSSTQSDLPNLPLAGLIPEGSTEVEKDYVVIPGVGRGRDYSSLPKGVSVSGKIAVVNRGDTTFKAKVELAMENGAIAMICINNDPSLTFNFSMDFAGIGDNLKIPVVFVFNNSKEAFGQSGSVGKLKIATNSVQKASDGNTISSFSSDGGDYNLDIGVDVAAPGQNIIGAVDAEYYDDNSKGTLANPSLIHGYEYFSGTSMSAPNYTGALASYLSEKNPVNNSVAKVADDTAYKTEKSLTALKAESSAKQLTDTSGNNVNSVRMQGAGVVNVSNMLSANSYVTSVDNDPQGFNENREQAKVELKNSGSLKVDDFTSNKPAYIEFDYKIHNSSNQSRVYKPSLSVMIPQLRVRITSEEFASEIEEASSSLEEIIGYQSGESYNPDSLENCPKGVGQVTMSINDDLVKKVDANDNSDTTGFDQITIAAGATETKHIKVRIDNLHFEKDFGTKTVDKYSGDLKGYFNRFFKDAGGSYVEGFLNLDEVVPNGQTSTKRKDLSIPYMGFYGDYTKGEAVEPFDFEKEERHLYNSDLAANYLQNLNENYKRPNIYVGSTIASRPTTVTSSELDSINDLRTNALADDSKFFSVTGYEGKELYAGSAASRYLVSTFYVNRAVSKATWNIKNSKGTSVLNGDVKDYVLYNKQSGTMTAGLMKSFILQEEDFTMHRGFAEIDLNKIKDEGVYTLSYSFTLLGTNTTQAKDYTLNIDRTSPKFKGATFETKEDGKGKLTVTSDGGENIIRVNGQGVVPNKVSGTKNDYSGTVTMNKKAVESDRAFVELSDFAHNNTTILLKPSQIHFVLESTFFTTKQDYEIELMSTKGGVFEYEISIVKAGGSEKVKLPKGSSYTLNVLLDSDLDVDDIVVEIEYEELEREETVNGKKVINYSYDETTGWLSIKMPATDDSTESITFSINQPIQGQEVKAKKKGCSGSVVATSIIGSSIALAGAAVAIGKVAYDKKSKKEAK